MQKKIEIYSSKTIITMVVLFFVFFWLLYSIGSFLHESQKISQEIEKIHQTNLDIEKDIVAKKEHLEYLKTPQRIEKEAKMQMGKKLPEEQVIVFVKEELDVLPSEKKRQQRDRIKSLSSWQKWQWIFFGEREP